MSKNLQTELRLQQTCFIWAWNSYPNQRGRLFHIHNTPENFIKGTMLIGAGMVKGIPDMLFLLDNGSYIFIEMKTDSKQSIYQTWFESLVSSMQGKYVVINSLEKFKELLQPYYDNSKNLEIYPTKVESKS